MSTIQKEEAKFQTPNTHCKVKSDVVVYVYKNTIMQYINYIMNGSLNL
jgi:hypothetical protein